MEKIYRTYHKSCGTFCKDTLNGSQEIVENLVIMIPKTFIVTSNFPLNISIISTRTRTVWQQVRPHTRMGYTKLWCDCHQHRIQLCHGRALIVYIT